MAIIGVDLNNNNKLDHVTFNSDECQTFINVTRRDCCNSFKKRKYLKKVSANKLMPVAWNPRRWWDR